MMTALESLEILEYKYKLIEEKVHEARQDATAAIKAAKQERKASIMITKKEANELMGYQSDNIYRFDDIPWNSDGKISLKAFEKWAWNKDQVKSRIKYLRQNIKELL